MAVKPACTLMKGAYMLMKGACMLMKPSVLTCGGGSASEQEIGALDQWRYLASVAKMG